MTTGIALDRDRFVKIHKLAQLCATHGERVAAITSATRMAKGASNAGSARVRAKVAALMAEAIDGREGRRG